MPSILQPQSLAIDKVIRPLRRGSGFDIAAEASSEPAASRLQARSSGPYLTFSKSIRIVKTRGYTGSMLPIMSTL
jgi:hypothetical protein